jgi:hypothetical protein
MKATAAQMLEQILEAYPNLIVEIGNGITTWKITLRHPQGSSVRDITFGTIEDGIARLHELLVKEAREKVNEAKTFAAKLQPLLSESVEP